MNDLWTFEPPCNPDSVHVSTPVICSGVPVALTAFNQFPATVDWYTSANSVFSIGSGATLTTAPLFAANNVSVFTFYAESDNCSAKPRTAVSVTVNPQPTVTISGPVSVCENITVSLTGAGAHTYTWNTASNANSVSISPNAPQYIAILLGTDINGCQGAYMHTITVHALPQLTLSSTAPEKICTGSSATLTASGASTYSWSTNDVTANTVVSPSATTTYSVYGTNANNCQAMATITQTTDICAGIRDASLKSLRFAIYPNPGQGAFTVSHNSNGKMRLLIFNALSQQVLEEFVRDPEMQINTGLPRGLYTVVLITENGTRSTVKLIID